MQISSKRPNETDAGYQKRIQEHIDTLQNLADEAIKDSLAWKRRALYAEGKMKKINELVNMIDRMI